MALKTGPDYTVELYSLSPDDETLKGGIFRLTNDDYLQVEAHSEAGFYSILWPTQTDLIKAVDTALDVFGAERFVRAVAVERGSVEEGAAIGERTAEDAIAWLKDEANDNKAGFFRMDGSEVAFTWSPPHKVFVDSNFSEAEIGMMIKGLPRGTVENMVARTALIGIAVRYPEAMSELSAVVPDLRQA